jgi:hypothetical protein
MSLKSISIFENIGPKFPAMYLTFALSLFLLFACQSFDSPPKKPFKLPIIIGENATSNECLSPEYMLNAWYDISYFNTISDTLNLSRPSKNWSNHTYQFFLPDSIEYSKFSNEGLQIIVDTVQEITLLKKPIWASYLFSIGNSDSAKVLQDDTLVQRVKSFPIYFVNKSLDKITRITMQDGSPMMRIEALDRNENWNAIEYWSDSRCGNSYYTFMLPPNHLLLTRGVKCSGDFYTKCRMRALCADDTVYSNEFSMNINEKQFQKPLSR